MEWTQLQISCLQLQQSFSATAAVVLVNRTTTDCSNSTLTTISNITLHTASHELQNRHTLETQFYVGKSTQRHQNC